MATITLYGSEEGYLKHRISQLRDRLLELDEELLGFEPSYGSEREADSTRKILQDLEQELERLINERRGQSNGSRSARRPKYQVIQNRVKELKDVARSRGNECPTEHLLYLVAEETREHFDKVKAAYYYKPNKKIG
jgi:hypothetical protein